MTMRILFKIEKCSNQKFVIPEEGEPVFLYIETKDIYGKAVISVNNILNQKIGVVPSIYGRNLIVEKMLLSRNPILATIAFASIKQNIYLVEVNFLTKS